MVNPERRTASKEAAGDSYQAIKARLEVNDLLLEDFPEVCYPVRQLEGKPQRTPGMLLNGESIKFEWTEKQLIFPRVPGSVCAGSIFRAVETLPKNMELWQEYRKRWIERANELWAVDPSDKGAWRSAMMAVTEFYRQNRQAMDAGAVVDWPEMFEEDEISGIQNMMNIYLENEATFWTEYQNDPQQNVQELAITEPGLAEKVLPDVPRGVVPAGTECLTLGADVQGELLYWIVTAWRDGFAGHIVAYGTVPTQPAIVFKAANAPLPLSQLYPVQNKEGQHEIALNTLIEEVMNHEWTTESGSSMTIDRGLIDANWDVSADTIHTVINRHYRFFLKNGRYGAYPLLPARGRGTTRGGLFYESKKQMESQTQFSYLTPPRTKEELVGTVWVNTNKIKSFVGHRLLAPVGAPGSLTIHDAPPGQHTLLFDHLTAEFATAATLGNLSYDKWVLKPTRTENHWWDALCLSAIANAMQGARLTVHDAPPKRIRYTFDPNGVG